MRLLFVIFTCCFLLAAPASADVVVWEDPESGLSLSYPDRWSRLTPLKPDTILRIAAPSTTDEAECRVRVRPENRFLIFPPRYDPAVQKVAYSTEFWKDYHAREYERAMIHRVRDLSGFGRGFASFMTSSYLTLGDDAARRTSMGYAAPYRDKAYILECSAFSEAFQNWSVLFQSIAGSVDFKKAHHESATGHYYDFLNR